jgi:hypothetical protein
MTCGFERRISAMERSGLVRYLPEPATTSRFAVEVWVWVCTMGLELRFGVATYEHRVWHTAHTHAKPLAPRHHDGGLALRGGSASGIDADRQALALPATHQDGLN